jgi:hypothetical protein
MSVEYSRAFWLYGSLALLQKGTPAINEKVGLTRGRTPGKVGNEKIYSIGGFVNSKILQEVKSFLKTEGSCPECHRWVALQPQSFCSALAEHKHRGRKCPGAGGSGKSYRYVVRNAPDAQRLAAIIAADEGKCLSTIGSGGHSMACGDGRDCHEERMRLAKALASFVLKHE